MNHEFEKQGKRRFYFYLILTILIASSAFYSGYQIGIMKGKEELKNEIFDRKEIREDDQI